MNHASLLRASILAIVTPVAACGGKTDTSTGATSTGAGGTWVGTGGSSAQGGSTSQGGSSAQGGSAGASAGASGSAGATQQGCPGATPIVVAGVDTGFDTCASGQVQRRAVVKCPSLLPRPAACVGTTGVMNQCNHDSDCTMMPNGACNSGSPGGFPGCFCSYGCTSDADCTAGTICECGDPIGYCVTAKCTSNAACPSGVCSTFTESPGCPSTTFGCEASGDACEGDKDCPANQQCAIPYGSMTGTRVCSSPMCAVGRPLVVADVALVSSLSRRTDWGLFIAVRTRTGDRQQATGNWEDACGGADCRVHPVVDGRSIDAYACRTA